MLQRPLRNICCNGSALRTELPLASASMRLPTSGCWRWPMRPVVNLPRCRRSWPSALLGVLALTYPSPTAREALAEALTAARWTTSAGRPAAQLSGIVDFGHKIEHRVRQFGHRHPGQYQFLGLQRRISLSLEQLTQRQSPTQLRGRDRARRSADHEIGRGHVDPLVGKPGQRARSRAIPATPPSPNTKTRSPSNVTPPSTCHAETTHTLDHQTHLIQRGAML
jgi:hypothetical protein